MFSSAACGLDSGTTAVYTALRTGMVGQQMNNATKAFDCFVVPSSSVGKFGRAKFCGDGTTKIRAPKYLSAEITNFWDNYKKNASSHR